jgi:hypothetical protein
MQQTEHEAKPQDPRLQLILEACAERISGSLKELAQRGDWDVVKSVLRVIDAHARAQALRAQGQQSRAHLWLVDVSRSPLRSPQVRTLRGAPTAA